MTSNGRTRPFNAGRPFTRADARNNGLAESSLRGSKYRRVFFDLYVDSSVRVTPQVRAMAALRICKEGSYASHFTAAEIWGGCIPAQPLTHVTVPAGAWRPDRRGIKAHEAKAVAEVTSVKGILVSNPAQTFLDLSAHLCLVDLVVLGDSLVRAKRTTPSALVEAAKRWSGRGARLARRAAALVRARVDSPMESRLRMLIVLAGLPEPIVNFVLRDEEGDPWMRFDLCYPGLKLIIEYDGRQHAESTKQWTKDLYRREDLDRLGWRIVVITAEGIYAEPEQTLRRITDALRERGAGVSRRRRIEWRAHFPGRATAA